MFAICRDTIRILCLSERGYSDAELPVMLLSQMVQESKEYSTIRPSWIARASASAALYIPRRPSVGAQAHACSCMRARALRRLGQLWHTHCGSSLRILCYFDIRARTNQSHHATAMPAQAHEARLTSLFRRGGNDTRGGDWRTTLERSEARRARRGGEAGTSPT